MKNKWMRWEGGWGGTENIQYYKCWCDHFLCIEGTVLDWFKSYLAGRHKSEQISCAASAPRYLTVGFPQGSHIGPQGFSYYTEEIPEIPEKTWHLCMLVCLYADDTLLYLSFSLNDYCTEEAVHIIEDCISDVEKRDVSKQAKVK